MYRNCLTFRTFFVHNMFSPFSAKRKPSDKDLPVLGTFSKSLIYNWRIKIQKRQQYLGMNIIPDIFFSVKNHNKFSSQVIVISSQNNIPKYCNKGHKQVLMLSTTIRLSVLTYCDLTRLKRDGNFIYTVPFHNSKIRENVQEILSKLNKKK